MKRFITFILIITLSKAYAQTSDFNNLLQSHVDEKGFVDYKALKKNEAKLDMALSARRYRRNGEVFAQGVF